MLKAVLFDFNGVIINDEPLHNKLLEQILVEENLRPQPGEFWEACVGRSDRACLTTLLERRGRVISDKDLDALVARKSRYYLEEIAKLEKLPTYPGLEDLIFQIRAAHLPMGVVSGAIRVEIEQVLQQLNLTDTFSVIVAGDDIATSKPEPDGYLLAVKQLNDLSNKVGGDRPGQSIIQPENCLAIEDTFAGVTAAKQAGMQVVGIANTYPFHMMQRCANWAVDYFTDLELDRIRDRFSQQSQSQGV
ncbi:MAG: HAD family phosphatase [Cyanobacteria bacterium J06638_20]